MVNFITEYFDIWATALTTKSNGRGKGADNQSPYGIKKLRELILELAVRGKLVPQDPSDEPASALLKQIAIEKARLLKEDKIKKQKALSEISDDEKTFELPQGWEWARLPDISAYKPGKTPSTKNPVYWSDDVADIPWVSISDMEHFGWVRDTNKRITQVAVDHVFKYDIIPAGSLLMSFKLTVGKVSILDVDAYHNEAIISMQPFRGISRDYLFKVLPNRALAGNTKSAIMGNTLNASSLALLLIPIPPLAEQHRIVAKVDELMNLCDQLEQQQTDSNSAHQALVEIVLATLTTAADQVDFTEAWQRIANHFDILFTTEHSIDQLKQTILQLAVMGKLVPQDPSDEPASVLLEQIGEEKARLVKEGKIKKQKQLPEISEDEKPFELPVGWEWTQLGNLSANIHYGYTASADHGSAGIRLLRITDIQDDSVNWEAVPGCDISENKANDYFLENGDILIARTGGTIGKSYLVEDINIKAVFASYLIRVKRIEGMYSPFIKSFLRSQLYWQQLYENSMGTGQPNVNATALKGLVFPIPPLTEQHRIVAKVDELMALCDTLKERLNDAQNIQVQLADAIVEQALA